MDFFSIIQAIMSFLSNIFGGMFGGGNTQNQKPSEVAGAPISGAQGAIAPQAQAAAIAPTATPKPSAEEIMASWKQEMAASTIPQSVQLAIAAKEPQITEQLRAAKSPQEMGNIQMAAYAEATKPEWDKFVAKSKGEVSKLMDETIREVSQSGMPSKEKEEALKGLRTEKEARVKALEAELKQIAPEQRIQIALSKEGQEKIQENITNSVKNYKEAVSKNVSDISRQNNGLAWTGSILGWASAGLAVASFVPVLTPFTLPAACITGALAGGCKVINNSGKDGSNFDFGMGIAEIGFNAIPGVSLVGKSAGLLANSASVVAKSEGFWGKVATYLPWATKATVAEGQAIEAVTAGHGVLKDILKNSASQFDDHAENARKIIKGVASGKATIIENTADKVIIRHTETGMDHLIKEGNLTKLVHHSLRQYKDNDALIGVYANAKRAGAVLLTNAGDNLIPSSTPSILPADGVAKQPAPKL